jgi:hypothetical protein
MRNYLRFSLDSAIMRRFVKPLPEGSLALFMQWS